MLRFPAVRTRCRIRLGSWAFFAPLTFIRSSCFAPPHPKARCPPRRATLTRRQMALFPNWLKKNSLAQWLTKGLTLRLLEKKLLGNRSRLDEMPVPLN
ncbi:hypothetical protein Fmac_001361 [Flemingia macrophylla]|uniref:Secreted protein n=1 Tax=Flemingia macrophylla TaxID=520843 RepID=A0ABD1NH01_9FABA